MALRSIQILDVDEERELACRLAGWLFLTGGFTGLGLLLLPGVEDTHWPWVVALAGACIVWGVFCLTLARPNESGALFWHVPSLCSLAAVAGVVAFTGGSQSPARFYLFFLLFYATYFYPRRQALLYVGGCMIVAFLPLAYEPSSIDGGYVGELVVLCPAYLVLGLMIIEGKELLLGLREQARSLALRDPLTELPNRRAMLEWLGAEMATGADTGLILVDLDGFKDVNTLHGYPAGDEVLREAARRLVRAVRTDDVVARLGGDEFAVLVPHAAPDAMRALCDRVLESMRTLDHRGVRLTASVGWVLYPNDARTVDEMIGAADFCMRGAKLTGKDRAMSALDWAPEDELAA